ncbi:MAG: DoxX family protein [Chloracidobacterium sp.]|nr:DoxX family protein [Chloracidobacterium sp.]
MTKTQKVIYWIATIWLSLGMASSAVVQLIRIPEGVQSVTHLGYPEYLLTILGVWKILGIGAILVPGLPVVKEWAYAGFFFVASGAMTSHLIMRDPSGELFPSILLLVLTVVSWCLRPESRKLTAAISSKAE